MIGKVTIQEVGMFEKLKEQTYLEVKRFQPKTFREVRREGYG
jgi:hypothetical protein